MKEKFYTYIYLDPRKSGKYCYENASFLYQPFYVGKGRNSRCYALLAHNIYCVNKIKKIIRENFEPVISILKSNISEEAAFYCERQWIREIGRADLKLGNLTNLTDGGEGLSNPSYETRRKIAETLTGRKTSIETRQKISKALKGKMAEENNPMFGKSARFGLKHSEEIKRKISQATFGKKRSEETKRKISQATLGRRHSEETKEKLSKVNTGEKNPMFGKPSSRRGTKLSEETKRKIVESKRRNPRPSPNKGKTFSEEYRKRLSEAHKGKHLSEETKRKLSEIHKGKKHSLESREKMRIQRSLKIRTEDFRSLA